MNILLIDNFDSFTRNLEHLIVSYFGTSPRIIEYPALEKEKLDEYDMIVISPGPGKPSEYPDYMIVFESNIPVLGICLGMQIMNEYYGGKTDMISGCIHGKTDMITFEGKRFEVARYHSLYVSKLAKEFEIIGENDQAVPMAIKHVKKKILGYQFHPESFLTHKGKYFLDYAASFFKNN
jgi:anthranilate synthase/aminodeoxychorismate synthase-like glutamine amidotransferase